MGEGTGTGMKLGARDLGYQQIRFDTHIEEISKRLRKGIRCVQIPQTLGSNLE